MMPTKTFVLGLTFALSLGGVPSGSVARPGTFVVAELPAGEVARGIPVKEREEAPDDPVADQAESDADARQRPNVEQPDVADPPDVEQPADDE